MIENLVSPNKRKESYETPYLGNFGNYSFKSDLEIFNNFSRFQIFNKNFPRTIDVSLPELEKELNRYTRFKFSNGFVGFLNSQDFSKGDRVSFIESKNYDFFSPHFIKESYCASNPKKNNSKIITQGGIFPFMYLLNSENGLGKIFIRDFNNPLEEGKNKYSRGIRVSIGVSPKRDGKFILGALKGKIISMYNPEKKYERLDLNN